MKGIAEAGRTHKNDNGIFFHNMKISEKNSQNTRNETRHNWH